MTVGARSDNNTAPTTTSQLRTEAANRLCRLHCASAGGLGCASTEGELLITPQTHAEDFTQADVDKFHRLMTELLATCQKVADDHTCEGAWTPSTADLIDQLGESKTLIADISRTLNRTRSGIRKISEGARQRVCDRAARPPRPREPR
ncbi:hypothetical protein ABZ915_43270 [Streptomyces sp. NPDC046915]|uniref:hypothetical protein n=1 Tax=Streptomyces sp. NPDC046915 TaxID=3155257 RepID=UPI00340D14B3